MRSPPVRFSAGLCREREREKGQQEGQQEGHCHRNYHLFPPQQPDRERANDTESESESEREQTEKRYGRGSKLSELTEKEWILEGGGQVRGVVSQLCYSGCWV